MKTFIKLASLIIAIVGGLNVALAQPINTFVKEGMILTPLKSQINFDHCHQLSFYFQEKWYGQFIEKIGKLNEPVTKAIGEGCYSKNGNLLVFMVPGNYSEKADIYKFNIANGHLEKAAFIGHNQNFYSSPQEFGPRVGNIIKLKGFSGDADCGLTQYYDYDFVNNVLELKKGYSKCEGMPGEWHNY